MNSLPDAYSNPQTVRVDGQNAIHIHFNGKNLYKMGDKWYDNTMSVISGKRLNKTLNNIVAAFNL